MIRTRYLAAARTGLGLLGDDAVAAAWAAPSALAGFTVGGLATHLAQQITGVPGALAADFSGKPVIGLYEHYGRAAWLAADIDNDYNTSIRDGGESGAEAGHAAVVAGAAAALADLEQLLPANPPETVSGNSRWPYAMPLGDFLRTRVLELVVHADDLAVSVGVDTPVFDADAFEVATAVLAGLAAERHGQANLVRALARAERAPATITAL